MKHDILIRQATQNDSCKVAEAVQSLLRELGGTEGPRLSQLTETARLVLQDQRVNGFIAEEHETVLGVLLLNQCTAIYAGGHFGEISELFVNPRFRSQGIAKRLVEAAMEFGRSQGWSRLEVGAPKQPDWERSLVFYLRSGFDVVGPRLRIPL